MSLHYPGCWPCLDTDGPHVVLGAVFAIGLRWVEHLFTEMRLYYLGRWPCLDTDGPMGSWALSLQSASDGLRMMTLALAI